MEYAVILNEGKITPLTFDSMLRYQIRTKIRETILHEINHFYMDARLHLPQGKFVKVIEPRLSLAVNEVLENKWGIPRVIWQKWCDICVSIYEMQPNEIQAKVQETLPHLNDWRNVLQSDTWECMKGLRDFSAAAFLKILLQEIQKYYEGTDESWTEEKGLKVVEYLQHLWIQEYDKVRILYQEPDYYRVKQLKKMSPLEFLQYWEPQIQKAGQILQRRICKLYCVYQDNPFTFH
jgi:hypothetical protein